MVTMTTIICAKCGTEKEKRAAEVRFAEKMGRQVFCSASCAAQFNNKQVKEYLDVICAGCGVTFRREAARVRFWEKHGKKSYCTKKCSEQNGREKEYIDVACFGCGKIVQYEARVVHAYEKDGHKFFCEGNCRYEYRGSIRKANVAAKKALDPDHKEVSYERTTETLAKLSESRKGKGLGPLSEKRRQRMSDAHLGTVQSAEHTAAIKEAMNKPETLEKISESVKKAYEDPEMRRRQYEATLVNLAKPEVREKISLGLKKAFEDPEVKERHKEAMNRPETKEKISLANTGKRRTQEHKNRMSIINKEHALKRWANTPPEERRAHMQNAIQKSMAINSSSLEKRVSVILEELEVLYIPQFQVGPYFIDFFLPEYEICLEIYGCFWHGCFSCEIKSEDLVQREKKRNKDRSREAYLRVCGENNGFEYVVIWEHEFKNLETILNSLLSK